MAWLVRCQKFIHVRKQRLQKKTTILSKSSYWAPKPLGNYKNQITFSLTRYTYYSVLLFYSNLINEEKFFYK